MSLIIDIFIRTADESQLKPVVNTSSWIIRQPGPEEVASTALPKEVQSCGVIPSQKDISPVHQADTDLRKIPAAPQNITSLPQGLPASSGSGMALTDREKFEVGCLIFKAIC